MSMRPQFGKSNVIAGARLNLDVPFTRVNTVAERARKKVD